MTVDIKRIDNILIAKIIGELDHHTAEEIRRCIDAEIIMPGTQKLIFDLSEMAFMDTSGIGVIVGRYKNIARLGGTAAVAGMNKQTKKVLELTGFGKILPFFDDVTDALEKFRNVI